MEDSLAKVDVISGNNLQDSKNNFLLFPQDKMGIATAKSMKKYLSITYKWSESFADFVDGKELHRFSSSKFNPKFTYFWKS